MRWEIGWGRKGAGRKGGLCPGGTVRVLVAAIALWLGAAAGEAWGAVQATEADLAVTGLRWDESDGTAYWDLNDNAYKYEVKLYRGSSTRATRTTSEHYYEFGSYFKGSGDYSFAVRAVGQNSVKGEWAVSDLWYVSSSDAKEIRGGYDTTGGAYDSNHGPGVSGSHGMAYGQSGGPGVSGDAALGVVTYGNSTLGGPTYGGNHWCQDGYGWWYQYADGTYPKNCWQCIDGRYYCFNESGYCRYGWILWQDKWYYCGADGALVGNTYTPDGYYVGADGVWVP